MSRHCRQNARQVATRRTLDRFTVHRLNRAVVVELEADERHTKSMVRCMAASCVILLTPRWAIAHASLCNRAKLSHA